MLAWLSDRGVWRLPISSARLAFVAGRVTFSGEQARGVLGYVPAVGFEDAMARCAEALR